MMVLLHMHTKITQKTHLQTNTVPPLRGSLPPSGQGHLGPHSRRRAPWSPEGLWRCCHVFQAAAAVMVKAGNYLARSKQTDAKWRMQ